MKKIFAILAIAGFMASCNNSGENKDTTIDSTKWKDSVNKMMENTQDSVNKMMNNTTDSVNKMIDNATKDTSSHK
jgi:hypothetical protein